MRWRRPRAASAVAPPAPPARAAAEPNPDNARLSYLRESYTEVLAATKHEDDKIGRFLAAISFILAGALFFATSEVLAVRHEVGGQQAPLIAIAFSCFAVAIGLAVLLYILIIAAPLTLPPGAKGSLLYFEPIAGETSDSWQSVWAAAPSELRTHLIQQYRDETLNLARRASAKRNRSRDASALFIVALLFFMLGVVGSLHALAHEKVIEAQAGQLVVLAWDRPLLWAVTAVLALFHLLLLYERLRSTQTRGSGRRRLREWAFRAVLAGTTTLLLVLMRAPLGGTLEELLSGPRLRGWIVVSAALVSAWGYWFGPARASSAEGRLRWWQPTVGRVLLSGSLLAAGVIGYLLISRGRDLDAVGLAVFAALSPVLLNLAHSLREPGARRRSHLAHSLGPSAEPDPGDRPRGAVAQEGT